MDAFTFITNINGQMTRETTNSHSVEPSPRAIAGLCMGLVCGRDCTCDHRVCVWGCCQCDVARCGHGSRHSVCGGLCVLRCCHDTAAPAGAGSGIDGGGGVKS